MNEHRITIKDSSFYLKSDKDEPVIHDSPKLNVIIVGANPNISKAYYKDAWVSNTKGQKPICFSYSGKKPHESSIKKQNDICITCEHNAWGSKITPSGVKVKSCSDYKRLVVILAEKHKANLYLLQISATSLKNLNAYQKLLASKTIIPNIVRTSLSLDTSVNYPRLNFKFSGFNPEKVQEYVDKLIGSDEVKILTGELDINHDAEYFGFIKHKEV